MKPGLIQFRNRNGLALAARLDLPAEGHPRACALFAHCFTCSKDLNAVKRIATALTVQGFAVLRFDFTGLGESDGAFGETTFTSNIEDIVDAAGYLEETFQAPSLLVGHSLGGAAVLQAAPLLPSVTAVATIGAPFDPGHVTNLFGDSLSEIQSEGCATVTIAGRSFRVGREMIEDLESQRVHDRIAGLDAALLIMHSPSDSIVGIDNAALIYEAARHPKSFVSLDGAHHLLLEERDAVFVGTMLGTWAARYMASSDAEHGPDEGHGHTASVRIGRDRYRTEVIAGGHAMLADEPVSLGGTDSGPTPYELLLGGLGACTAITMRMYADRKEWPLEGVQVSLTHRKVSAEECDCGIEGKARVDLVERTVHIEGDELDDAQRARLLNIADRCPVHRSMHEGTFFVRTTDGGQEGDSE